jgi:hypothetical protein
LEREQILALARHELRAVDGEDRRPGRHALAGEADEQLLDPARDLRLDLAHASLVGVDDADAADLSRERASLDDRRAHAEHLPPIERHLDLGAICQSWGDRLLLVLRVRRLDRFAALARAETQQSGNDQSRGESRHGGPPIRSPSGVSPISGPISARARFWLVCSSASRIGTRAAP